MTHRWTPPPGWPTPPPGWRPPPGWQPEPAWGPPPPGWSFWQDDGVAPPPARHATSTLVAVAAATALVGTVVGAAVAAVAIGSDDTTTRTTEAVLDLGTEARGRPDEDTVTLTVHSDGCGVVRTEPQRPLENLTWSVRDEAGFEVLGRNAQGETRYRYFQGGTYTVVLTSWGGSSYVPVSNEVTIRC